MQNIELRDHFAANIMEALVVARWETHLPQTPDPYPDYAEGCATIAYVMADAMLAARGPAKAPKRSVAEQIATEIQEIMKTYRQQEAEGGVDTPGGLEHMGDVWRMLSKWDEQLRNAPT